MESSSVVIDMIPHEGRNEVIRMIIQRLHAQIDRVTGFGGSCCQILRLQLFFQKGVTSALEKKDE